MHVLSFLTLPGPKKDALSRGKRICQTSALLSGSYTSLGLALMLVLIWTSTACKRNSAASQSNVAPQSGSTEQALGPKPFADFPVKIEVQDTKFQVSGDFTLGSGNNGIDLAKDNVNLKVGASSIVIPPGSFEQNEKGRMKYKTEADGVAWTVVIRDEGEGKFGFKVGVESTKDFGQLKAEDITLTIGDDTGNAKSE